MITSLYQNICILQVINGDSYQLCNIPIKVFDKDILNILFFAKLW